MKVKRERIRSRVLVAALSICGVVGCQPSGEDPVRAAGRFVAAANYGQGMSLWPYLSNDTREVLQREAERASNQIGERRNVAPSEMLQIVDVPTFDPRRIPELRSRTKTDAQVVFFGMQGKEYPVNMIYEEGQWRVRLSLNLSLREAISL